MRRLVRELMQAEVIAPNGAEGAFDAGPLACVPLIHAKVNACSDAEGPSERGLRPASPTVAPRRHGSRNQPQ
jgi:hypothetical protein